MYKKILSITLFLLFVNFVYGQKKEIKVLEIKSIKYYYVYKTYNYCSKDTIILLSSRADSEFKKIKLEIENCYKIETRPKSAIKISEEEYMFCKPTETNIEGVRISDKDKLPVLILDHKKLEKCK